MALDFNLPTFIESLGLIQGLILGITLFFLHNKKNKTTRYLGVFILLFSLPYIFSILEITGTYHYYPKLFFLPLDFNWLLFAVFYKYVQEVSIFDIKNKDWVLLPGIVSFLFQFILFFTSINIIELVYSSFIYKVSFYLSLIYGLFLGYKSILLINRHKSELLTQYTSIEKKDLTWAKIFIICGIFFTIIKGFLILIEVYDYFNTLFIIVDVALLYWVSLKGVLQENSFHLIQKYTANSLQKKVRKETIHKGELVDLYNEINKKIIFSEKYLKKDFNLINMAEEVKIHPKKVSKILNSVSGKNFNSYVNRLRVEKAKKIIKSKAFEYYTMEAIGYEVGFSNKSSFFKAFKKETGITPLQFKKEEA